MYLIQNKIVSAIKVLFLVVLAFLFSAPVFANEEQQVEKKGKFDPGLTIMEHITDAHEWHLWAHTSIPLPVILYSKDKGMECFSSSRFEHGEVNYNGYKLLTSEYVRENNLNKNKYHNAQIVRVNSEGNIDEAATASLYDISITKNVASLLISVILLLLIFTSVAKSYVRNKDKAPKGLQAVIEPMILFVRDDIAKSVIGEKYYKRYMPFLLTIFFFIWINNMLGIIPIFPGGANVTGNVAVTMSLAVIIFLITTFSAKKSYWRHVFAMPNIPVGVLFLLTPIEILGVFLRPFVLMIRLFANMLAGHIVALSFFSLIFIFGEINAGLGLGVSVVSLAFTVFMTLLELLVAFLQAYVFTLLSAIYFGAATEEHGNHDHPPHAEMNEHIEEAAVI